MTRSLAELNTTTSLARLSITENIQVLREKMLSYFITSMHLVPLGHSSGHNTLYNFYFVVEFLSLHKLQKESHLNAVFLFGH